MDARNDRTYWSIAHLGLTVVGMTGIAGIFLPFASGYSPWDVLVDGGWRLALPAFLAALAAAASIRWIISGSLSAPERAIAYVVGASTASVTISLLVQEWQVAAVPWTRTTLEWLMFVCPVLILVVGLCVLIRNAKREPFRQFSPVMSIQVAYVTHAALPLVGLFGEWQVGAFCILVAVLAFVLQMFLASAVAGR